MWIIILGGVCGAVVGGSYAAWGRHVADFHPWRATLWNTILTSVMFTTIQLWDAAGNLIWVFVAYIVGSDISTWIVVNAAKRKHGQSDVRLG